MEGIGDQVSAASLPALRGELNREGGNSGSGIACHDSPTKVQFKLQASSIQPSSELLAKSVKIL
jgi:hypothetical protein